MPIDPKFTAAVASHIGCPAWIASESRCDSIGHKRSSHQCYCAAAAEAVLELQGNYTNRRQEAPVDPL